MLLYDVGWPRTGPFPTSHTEVCCRYRFARPGQRAPFLEELSQFQHDYNTLCENCPWRLKFQELLGSRLGYQPPQRSSDAPQKGILALAEGCKATPAGTGSQPRKRKKAEPRQARTRLNNLTIEIRPPRFKRKLWFGTYRREEIDRAMDAVHYYMGDNQPYNHPDSPLIFAAKPLKGITYEDLQPSCDQFIQVGDKQELAYVYFARQVREVIHYVTGKQKKSFPPKTHKRKVTSKKIESLLNEASQKLDVYDPIICSACGSTPTSTIPCASGATFSSADDMVSDISDAHYVVCDPSPEADSQLVALNPCLLPPPGMLTYGEEISIPELLSSSHWGDETFPAGGFTFSINSPSVVPPLSYGESSVMKENDFL